MYTIYTSAAAEVTLTRKPPKKVCLRLKSSFDYRGLFWRNRAQISNKGSWRTVLFILNAEC